VIAETLETNNTSVRQVVIGPDLVVATLVAPATAASGSALTLSDTTRNQGAGGAGASTTRFYLSTNAVLDTADVALGERPVPALAAGTASTASTPVTIPAGLAAGSYWIIAQADASGVVGETLETNNTTPSAVQIGPDLAVSALTVPAAAGAGSGISVSDTTANQGSSPAIASSTAFYLSTDSTYDAADILLGSRPVPALAAGASSSASTGLTIPAATATGIYFVLARADADGAVAETNEINNSRARQIVIGTDLVVSTLSVPATGGAGAALTVSDTTLNQGGGTAGASTTAFYLSTNSILDSNDVPVGSRAVPALAPGASSAAATVVTIPAGTATGTYFVIARADGDGVVAETVETNNTSARQVVIGPDLLVGSLTAPATATPGAAITVTDTTRNQGGGAAGASTTRFYLSTNTLLDGSDVPLGSRPVGALAPGAGSIAATTVTLPASLAVGTYWVLAQADADGVVGETVETNNTGAATVQIGADLAIAAFTVPGTAGAGSPLTVNDTTVNQGSGTAAASTTAFYLSTNSVFDAGDVLLGSRGVPALAPATASPGTTALPIPAATVAGTYFVIARVDADDAVAETVETNNTSARQVVIGPDLVVATFAAPPTAVAGSAITVSDTTRNQGAGGAGASTTRFYLSTNALLDTADAVLGDRAVAALGAGAASTASTSVTIPAGTVAGSYFLIIRVDADGTVAETQEVNNTAPVPIRVTP
jgi:subtilase family serine protease